MALRHPRDFPQRVGGLPFAIATGIVFRAGPGGALQLLSLVACALGAVGGFFGARNRNELKTAFSANKLFFGHVVTSLRRCLYLFSLCTQNAFVNRKGQDCTGEGRNRL